MLLREALLSTPKGCPSPRARKAGLKVARARAVTPPARERTRQRQTPARIATRARARNSVPLGSEYFAQLVLNPRLGQPGTRCNAVWTSAALTSGMRDTWAPHTPSAPAEPLRTRTRARAATAGTPAWVPACAPAPRQSSLPSRAPEHGRACVVRRGAGGPFKAGRADPARGSALEGGACSSPPALCARLRARVAAEVERGGSRGPGRRAAPPPGPPGGRLRRRREERRRCGAAALAAAACGPSFPAAGPSPPAEAPSGPARAPFVRLRAPGRAPRAARGARPASASLQPRRPARARCGAGRADSGARPAHPELSGGQVLIAPGGRAGPGALPGTPSVGPLARCVLLPWPGRGHRAQPQRLRPERPESSRLSGPGLRTQSAEGVPSGAPSTGLAGRPRGGPRRTGEAPARPAACASRQHNRLASGLSSLVLGI